MGLRASPNLYAGSGALLLALCWIVPRQPYAHETWSGLVFAYVVPLVAWAILADVVVIQTRRWLTGGRALAVAALGSIIVVIVAYLGLFKGVATGGAGGWMWLVAPAAQAAGVYGLAVAAWGHRSNGASASAAT